MNNNNKVLIAAAHTAAFQVSQGGGSPQHVSCREFDFSNGDLCITRDDEDPNARGYIVNTGIRIISLEYRLKLNGKQVGPVSDTVLPGQFKEIGAGPGVEWHVVTYRGRRDKKHAAMEK